MQPYPEQLLMAKNDCLRVRSYFHGLCPVRSITFTGVHFGKPVAASLYRPRLFSSKTFTTALCDVMVHNIFFE